MAKKILVVLTILIVAGWITYQVDFYMQPSRPIPEMANLPVEGHWIVLKARDYSNQSSSSMTIFLVNLDTKEIFRWSKANMFRGLDLIDWESQTGVLVYAYFAGESKKDYFRLFPDGVFERVNIPSQLQFPVANWDPEDPKIVSFKPDGIHIRTMTDEDAYPPPIDVSYETNAYPVPQLTYNYNYDSVKYPYSISTDLKSVVFPWCNLDGTACTIYRTDITGQNLEQLTNNKFESVSSLQWSPDDTKISFVAGNILWVTDLQHGETIPITKDVELFQWSPDGQQIAFVSRSEGYNYEEWAGDAGIGGLITRQAQSIFVIDVNGQNLTRLTYLRLSWIDFVWMH